MTPAEQNLADIKAAIIESFPKGANTNLGTPGLSVGIDPEWYSPERFRQELQNNLGMGVRHSMLNPAAGAEQADLNEFAHRPYVDVRRGEAGGSSIWRRYAGQLRVNLANLCQKVAQLLGRRGS